MPALSQKNALSQFFATGHFRSTGAVFRRPHVTSRRSARAPWARRRRALFASLPLDVTCLVRFGAFRTSDVMVLILRARKTHPPTCRRGVCCRYRACLVEYLYTYSLCIWAGTIRAKPARDLPECGGSNGKVPTGYPGEVAGFPGDIPGKPDDLTGKTC